VRFSILITTFKRRNFLGECIQNCLNQTFPPSEFEIILCNDFPNDFIGNLNERIKIINHKINIGEMPSINEMLNYAKGEYIIILADDDIMHPRCLEYLNEVINLSPSAQGYFPRYRMGETASAWPIFSLGFRRFEPFEFFRWYIKNGMREIIGFYGAIRRDSLVSIGGIPILSKGFSPYSDTILPLLLTEIGEVVLLDESLFFFRTHSSSVSFRSGRVMPYLVSQKSFVSRIRNIIPRDDVYLIEDLCRVFANDLYSVCSRQNRKVLRVSFYLFSIIYHVFFMKGLFKLPVARMLFARIASKTNLQV
jgi:glycosyltransferase involved in cell wall biosynthesis